MLFDHWSNFDSDHIENVLIITTEFTVECFSEELLIFFPRACLHGGGEPQVGGVTRLAVVEK